MRAQERARFQEVFCRVAEHDEPHAHAARFSRALRKLHRVGIDATRFPSGIVAYPISLAGGGENVACRLTGFVRNTSVSR